MKSGTRGNTLIEVVITVAIIAIVSSVASLGVRRIDERLPNTGARMLADSVEVAISQSRSIVIAVLIQGRTALAAANPDGSVTADSAFHFDPLSGRHISAR